MITELSRRELIYKGARCRLGFLRDQAGYTLGLAAQEGQPLEDLLPTGYVKEVQVLVDSLVAAEQDKVLMHADAKEATSAHHSTQAQAKIWKRKVAWRAARAARLGKTVPDALLRIPQARNGPELAVQVTDKLKLLEANKDAMPGTGVDDLIAEGQTLAANLQSVDADQEIKRFSALPNAVQEFYCQKGLLYTALKVINDAAQELHAGDPVTASRFNLNILHRRGRVQAQPPAPQPTSTPQPTPVGA